MGLLRVCCQTVLSVGHVGANRSAGKYDRENPKEAQTGTFFYQHLVNTRQQTRDDPEAFRFYFSAFIQAARSVTWTLKKEETEKWKKWEPTWRANRSEEERKLLKIAADLRNVEVKEGGANLPMELEEVVIDAFVETSRVEASNPMGGTIVRGQVRKQKVNRLVHYFEDEDGKQEITAFCQRYLEVQEKSVRDFCADMNANAGND